MQLKTSIPNKRTRIIVVGTIILLSGMGAGIGYVFTHWGIQGRYFPNTNWEGRPKIVKRDHDIFLRGKGTMKPLSTAIFSVQWKGWMMITESGEYTFATNSDDGSFLSIDGQQVVDNGGAHGLKKATGTISLEKGSHQIEVLYFTIGGFNMIETFWTPPNSSEEQLPGERLFSKRPSMIEFIVRQKVLSFGNRGI